MKKKNSVLVIIAFCCFGWMQAQEDCGKITLTSLEEISADIDDNSNGKIKITLHDEQPADGVITFEYTGDNGVHQDQFNLNPVEEDIPAGNRIYEIDGLSAGIYTIISRKYCIIDWENGIVSSADTAEVTVRAVESLRVTAEEERGALSTCIHEGIAKFTATTGTAPYVLEITSGPENNSKVGKSYTFNESPFYLGSLQNGTYAGTITDSNGFEVPYSITINTYNFYLYSILEFSYQSASPVIFKPYLNHADGPYNVFFLDFYSFGSNKDGISSYTSSPDSIMKYFKLEWYFSGEENVSYPIEYKKLKDTDAQPRYYATLPEGMNFKDVTDGSKMLKLKQTGYKDEVITNPATPGCNADFQYDLIRWDINLKQYAPVKDVGSDAFRFSVYSSSTEDECTAGLTFPLLPSSDIELIIFPIHYEVNFRENNGTLTPVESGDYNGNASEYCRIPNVKLGTYVIKYKDKLENEWEQVLEATEDDINKPVENVTVSVAPQIRGFTFKDFREANADDYNDMGSCICLLYRFGTATLTKLTFTYEEVPNGFFLPAGTTEEIAMGATSFYPTRNNGYYQFVPGKYKFSFTPPDGCGLPYVHEVIVDEPEIQNFEYEITSDCDNLNIRLSNGIRFRHPDRARGYGNPNIWESNTLTYCIAIERTDVDGNNRKEFFNTAARVLFSNPVTSIPLDQVMYMDGKEVVDCKFSAYFYLTSTPPANIGNFTGDRQFRYARPIDVDFEKIKSGGYAAFKIDPTKTNGYICGNDAQVSVAAVGGGAPYTYSLYKTNSFDQPPGDSEIPVDTKTGGDNEIVVFTIVDGEAGDRYWVKAEDASGCYDPKYNGVVIYTLDASVSIHKTEDLCDGDTLTLSVYYMPDANYRWYQGGTIVDGDVVGGTLRLQGLGRNEYTVSNNASDNNLGIYHVHITENNNCGLDMIYSVDITFVPQLMIWNPQGGSSDWNSEANWYPQNQGLPFSCTDVYIPGNVQSFPSLAEGGKNICRDIYFMPGAQLGQPQLLDYRHAYVQIDYGRGVLGSTQDTDITHDQLLALGRDNITSDHRIRYGAATSGVKLERDRWNMLSAPLGYIVTGDFAFGGFPFSYIKKFDAENGNEESYIAGKWVDYSNETTLTFQAGQGFGHLYYDYNLAPYYSMDHISQWDTIKNKYELTAPKPESILGSGIDFGLAVTNGILRFPYFADEDLSKAHRNHSFTPLAAGNKTEGTSVFSFFYQAPRKSEDFLQWTGSSSNSYRNEKAYRFIPEQHTFEKNKLDFSYSVSRVTAGDKVLIGNPYMSALDFNAFLEANPGIKDIGYQIFNGRDGYHDITRENADMVAPMQSILVEAATTGTLNVNFNAKDMAKTDAGIRLRSVTGTEPNQITITATNEAGEVKAYIRQSYEASDEFCRFDLSKIIASPPVSKRPEIYTLTHMEDNRKRALVVNTIESNDLIIPIGIITTYAGEIKLEFTGMDLYDAAVTFIDMEKGETTITGMETFSYTFNYVPQLDEDNYAVAKEDRFMLRISPKITTGADNTDKANDVMAYIHNDDLVVNSSRGNEIERVQVYDIEGRRIYSRYNINSTFFKEENLFRNRGVYIIKVHTRNITKEVKVIR